MSAGLSEHRTRSGGCGGVAEESAEIRASGGVSLLALRRASGPRRRPPRARSSTCSPPARFARSGLRDRRRGLARGAARRRRSRGARRPVPVRRRRRALSAAGGPRRARLAAPARRLRRRRRGRPRRHPASGRAALGRPGPLHRRSPAAASSTWSPRSRPRSRARSSAPEARDRIQAFLKLRAAAAAAMEEMRPDAFVRRLVERIGLRRHRLFAATPETAERLQSLARLAERAAEWSRREPRGSVRDFVRQLTAVADAGDLDAADSAAAAARRGGHRRARPGQGPRVRPRLPRSVSPRRDRRPGHGRTAGCPPSSSPRSCRRRRAGSRRERRRRLAYMCDDPRAPRSWCSAGPPPAERERRPPRASYEAVRDALGGEEEVHAEELFGPAEGLHSTYRMLRDEVLEASWRAGSALSEMRLDTAEDVNAAVARYLELLKLAALIQRPGEEPAAESLAALNELICADRHARAAGGARALGLDDYVARRGGARAGRGASWSARQRARLERFIPRRGDGLALSASDIDLYRTCPLKYKFARVFAIPQEPTINQRFGILIHQVLERFHTEELREPRGAARTSRPIAPGSLDRLLAAVRVGLAPHRLRLLRRRAPVPRPRRRRARPLSRAPHPQRRSQAGLARAQLRVRDRPAPAPRPGRSRRPASGRRLRADRLQDRGAKAASTRRRRADPPLPPGRAGGLGGRPRGRQPTGTSSTTSGSRPPAPDDAERVERTVLEVGPGIEGQDFEPRPSLRDLLLVRLPADLPRIRGLTVRREATALVSPRDCRCVASPGRRRRTASRPGELQRPGPLSRVRPLRPRLRGPLRRRTGPRQRPRLRPLAMSIAGARLPRGRLQPHRAAPLRDGLHDHGPEPGRAGGPPATTCAACRATSRPTPSRATAPCRPSFFSATRLRASPNRYAIIFDNHGVPIWWYRAPVGIPGCSRAETSCVRTVSSSHFEIHRLDGSLVRTLTTAGRPAPPTATTSSCWPMATTWSAPTSSSTTSTRAPMAGPATPTCSTPTFRR